jgi:dCTP deaminase
VSVLSKKEIIARIAKGDLIVSPILDPDTQIGTVSIDLRFGTTAAIVRGSDLSHIDPRSYARASKDNSYVLEQGKRRKLEKVSVPFGHPLLLHAGSLILVPTLEWVQLPKDIKGVVTARSSWAREGLSIATATFINPCYNGIITLELANLGQIPIALYPGMRLAQLAFYTIDADSSTECDKAKLSQFNLSCEPEAGDITKGDTPFIPL